MQLLIKSLLVISPFLFANGVSTESTKPATVEGIVISNSTSRPVGNTYLYIVPGEEEALTDINGKFVITTWQKFPLSVTAEHPNFKKAKLLVSAEGTKQVIKLQTR